MPELSIQENPWKRRQKEHIGQRGWRTPINQDPHIQQDWLKDWGSVHRECTGVHLRMCVWLRILEQKEKVVSDPHP